MKLSVGQYHALVVEARDEIMGVLSFVADHGKLEIGTPQSAWLVVLLQKLSAATERSSKIPRDYPRT